MALPGAGGWAAALAAAGYVWQGPDMEAVPGCGVTPWTAPRDFAQTIWGSHRPPSDERKRMSDPEQRQDGAEPENDPSPAKSDADRAKDKEQEMEESGEELPG